MNHLLLTLPIFILVFSNIKAQDPICVDNSALNIQCYKIQDAVNYLEYYREDPSPYVIKVKLKPEITVHVECTNKLTWDIMPKINLPEVDILRIRFCPYPQNGYRSALQQLNITKVNEKFILEGVTTTDVVLTKNDLVGFENISYLKIADNDYVKFDKNFLAFNHNLKQINLGGNQLNSHDLIELNNATQVWFLDMSNSGISDVKENMFENMKNLQHLYINSNKLKVISKKMLKGLDNIRNLELSANKIEKIDDDSFEDFNKLVNISLRQNNLGNISKKVFEKNLDLYEVRLGTNPQLILEDYTFANLPHLAILSIPFSNLMSLPEHLFQGSTNIKIINLQGNKLSILPENVFSGLENLEELYLHENRLSNITQNVFSSLKKLTKLSLRKNMLKELPDTVFSSLNSLEILNLGFNNLETIRSLLLKDVNKLKKLDLMYNNIKTVDNFAFSTLEKLKILNLSHNEYKMDNEYPLLSNCVELYELDLSHNLIEIVPQFSTQTKLKTVDLSYNNISDIQMTYILVVSNKLQINLSNNKIGIINYDIVFSGQQGEMDIDIENNPIGCTCFNYKFLESLRMPVPGYFFKNFENISCAFPEIYSEIKINNIKLDMLSCPIKELTDNYTACPENCACIYKPFSKTAIIDCQNGNLTEYPDIRVPEKVRISRQTYTVNKTEVNLAKNRLATMPKNGSCYENVTNLVLSDNLITDVNWIPNKLRELHLNQNKIKHLDDKIIKKLNASNIKLSLANNPWTCDCETLVFQDFLHHYKKVDSEAIQCNGDGTVIRTAKGLCKSYTVVITVVASCVVVTLAILVALYYRYTEEVKVWLFSKKYLKWLVREKDLDRNKTYDVFISYSHEDEAFVAETLLPGLEDCESPYKTCVHSRDWPPGELIIDNIHRSIMESRKTLVVLSKHFLKSRWGQLEFRTAHIQAIKENRTRVIVVILEEINEEELDDSMKIYLKTNTYVKWGDEGFWKKLRYALPHSKLAENKLGKIMSKIDDKFELVIDPTKNNCSTPPILNLDPSLLKKHPHNLTDVQIIPLNNGKNVT